MRAGVWAPCSLGISMPAELHQSRSHRPTFEPSLQAQLSAVRAMSPGAAAKAAVVTGGAAADAALAGLEEALKVGTGRGVGEPRGARRGGAGSYRT